MAQQYRHGVLIGNWNEDQYGIERAQDPESSGTYLPTNEHYLSIAKASYVRHDMDSYHSSRNDRLAVVDRRAGVGSTLISQQKVSPNEQYVTTYSSLGQGQPGRIEPDYTLSKTTTVKFEKIDKINAQECPGRGSYFTEHRDNFREEHSVLHQDPKEREELDSHLKKYTMTCKSQIPVVKY